MKKYLLLASVFVMSLISYAQTTLYDQDFESGSTGWNLQVNSSLNGWIVNNAYTATFPLTSTPNQNAGITGNVQSNYLHVYNVGLAGVFDNALYLSSATADSIYATQNTDISTTGYFNVNLSMYYICNGGSFAIAGNPLYSYGQVEYSTNSGTSWQALGGLLYNVSTWTTTNLTDAALDNQATLRFRFKWVTGASAADPPFSIDEVKVTGNTTPVNTINTGTISPSNICPGESILVPFTISGSYTAGNNFHAELSNAAGSFASPVTIGTLGGTSAGGISSEIPMNTPAGTGYRIRVTATTPATTGTDNGTNLTMYSLPVVNYPPITPDSVCHNGTPVVLVEGTPAGGIFLGSGVSDTIFTPNILLVGNNYITYYYTDGNGCSNSDSSLIVVKNCTPSSGILSNQLGSLRVYPNPSTGMVYVDFPESLVGNTLQVSNVLGAVVFEKKITSTNESLNLENGNYFVTVKNTDIKLKITVLESR